MKRHQSDEHRQGYGTDNVMCLRSVRKLAALIETILEAIVRFLRNGEKDRNSRVG